MEIVDIWQNLEKNGQNLAEIGKNYMWAENNNRRSFEPSASYAKTLVALFCRIK